MTEIKQSPTQCLICKAPLQLTKLRDHPATCSDVCQAVLDSQERDLHETLKTPPGLRYNAGKTRFSLVPIEVVEALAAHYTVGAKKYEDNNWRKGLKYTDTYDCAMRHITAWMKGERIDEETGSSHLIAAIWNLVALEYFDMYPQRYGEFDDRYHQYGRGAEASIELLRDMPRTKEWRHNYDGRFVEAGLILEPDEIVTLNKMIAGWAGMSHGLDLNQMVIEMRQHKQRDATKREKTDE